MGNAARCWGYARNGKRHGSGMSEFVTLGEGIRAADAKEVGMGNPAEETCCPPESNYGFISTFWFTSTTFPPSKIRRVKVTLFVVKGWSLETTKLKVVSASGAKAGLSFVPPITQRAACPTTLPLSSRRKICARADSIFSANVFFIVSLMTAFLPTCIGLSTLTVNVACAAPTASRNADSRKTHFARFLILFFIFASQSELESRM
jgi:hypothetical protein